MDHGWAAGSHRIPQHGDHQRGLGRRERTADLGRHPRIEQVAWACFAGDLRGGEGSIAFAVDVSQTAWEHDRCCGPHLLQAPR